MSHTSETVVDDVSQFKHPDRVWTGPLNSIMQKSYTTGITAGIAASTFSWSVDRFLITPYSAPRWPTYAKVLPQYRGYGWILFSLGIFQYFVEDTELSEIIDQNHNKMLEAQQEEYEYVKQLEAKRRVSENTPVPAPVSKHTV